MHVCGGTQTRERALTVLAAVEAEILPGMALGAVCRVPGSGAKG